MDVIELKNVTYTYPLVKEPALDDVTFTFKKGRFYGVIGENGGGKTTLCNLIRGLVPHFYKGKLRGEALINGKNIKDLHMDDLATSIGYIFQNPFTQISGVKETVFEEIAMGLENLGVPKEEMIERTINVIKLLKIEELVRKNPNALSGGQRQRVAFASIIVMESDIFVIDEPTSQLDPEGSADVFDIIHTLKEKGKTVILVEHKVDLMAEFADEVLVMQNGRLARHGATREVLSDPALEGMGATLPPVAMLGMEMGRRGMAPAAIPVSLKEAEKVFAAY